MYLIFCFLILTLIFLSACNEFNAPSALWDPNKPFPISPVISSVLPPNTAVAGVREITIIGQNFSKHLDTTNNLDSMFVRFGSQQAVIKSISTTLDTIVVYRPSTYGSLNINVMYPAADSIAHYPYNLENPISSLAGVSGIVSTNLLVMEADKGDTIWIGSMSAGAAKLGYIYKLLPDGVTLTVFKDTSYLIPSINKKPTDFANSFADLKFGPGGFLYATFAKVNSIYCMYPDSNAPKIYATLSANSTAKFDFDDNNNLYTGNSNGLFLVKTDRSNTSVGDYTGITFGEVRVIKEPSNEKYVYALVGATATPQTFTALYKSKIDLDGTVENKQLVYNISTDTTVKGCTISSFNVKADGTVLLSLLNNTNYSLFVLEKNGSILPYYNDITILPIGIDQLIWGNDRYLYLSRGKTNTSVRLYKMGIEQNGAQYLGRNL